MSAPIVMTYYQGKFGPFPTKHFIHDEVAHKILHSVCFLLRKFAEVKLGETLLIKTHINSECFSKLQVVLLWDCLRSL